MLQARMFRALWPPTLTKEVGFLSTQENVHVSSSVTLFLPCSFVSFTWLLARALVVVFLRSLFKNVRFAFNETAVFETFFCLCAFVPTVSGVFFD